jgi:hypothetical protein
VRILARRYREKGLARAFDQDDASRAALAYSAIGVWLLFEFGRQFNKPPDRFSTRWEVALGPAPVVYRAQKLLGYPHLK